MTFKARVFIQGAGCYVPHTEGDKLLVLFPRHDHPKAAELAVRRTGEICDHHFVVQFDARCLNPDLPPKLWTGFEVSKHWVGFDSDSAKAMTLKQGSVPGLQPIQELLAQVALGQHAGLDPRALPGANFQPDLLAGGFHAAAGQVSAHSDYQGVFTFKTRGGASVPDLKKTLASVLKIELGEVSRFALNLKPFGEDVTTVPLAPVGDRLDVWVRYFCDLRRPDPNTHVPEPGDLDEDFVLAYLLRKDLDALLDHQVRHRLPIPEVAGSWLRDGPIGGDPRRCMGPSEEATSFSDPLVS